MTGATYVLLRGLRLALPCLVLALLGCEGIANQTVTGTDRFVSEDFGFEVSLSDTLNRAGWFIIRERDSALTHTYTPPDSSEWTAVAVVIPPAVSFPSLAPFNVDVFRLKNASSTVADLADMRVAQVGADSLILSRRALVVDGEDAVEVVFRQGSAFAFETFFSRSGMGYTINALGAPDFLSVPRNFTVDSRVYGHVVGSFRYVN